MSKLFDALKISWQASERRLLFYNYVPRRGAKFQENLKWVRPEKKLVYHPGRTGDLVGFPQLHYDSPYLPFLESEELKSADEKIKKVFSLGYQRPYDALKFYENELVERVKKHKLDTSSEGVRIARYTAKIRYNQAILFKKQTRTGFLRKETKMLVDKRKKLLKKFRLRDYKKFEWLLEKLELEFRPAVPVNDSCITRKKSLTRLAKYKVEEAKEEKIAELKKAYDEQKIPFLEKKMMTLKKIKELEEKNNLDVTVTEADIEECIKKLENVKIEIAKRTEKGYKRKIHPYFLVPYEEDVLWEKEKAGELIREQLELSEGNSGDSRESISF